MIEETIRNWMRRADNDLKIGKDEMATDNPAQDMVCFHMQQCAEKYLKVYLIFHGQEYPRTHNLEALLALCIRIDPDFQQLVDEGASELTQYATSFRYGEEFYFPDIEETNRAIALAERVRGFVRQKLKQEGFSVD